MTNICDMRSVHDQIAACTKCVAFRKFGYWKFPPGVHGNPGSKVWIVGADPRRIDDALRKDQRPQYWMGASRRNSRDPIERRFGRLLEKLVYLTDAVKCQRPGSAIPLEAIRNCPSTWLCTEISTLRPLAILALGDDAAVALNDCEKDLTRCGTKVVLMPHPSPANGAKIASQYGAQGWEAYKAELVRTFEGWRHLLPKKAHGNGAARG